MADDVLYKPKDLFDTRLKQQYHDAAIEIFDQYADQAHVDIDANKVHVREYKEAAALSAEYAKKTASTKGKKTAALIGFILCFLVGAILFVAAFVNGFKWIPLVIGIVLILGGVGLIFVYRSQKNKAKNLEAELAKYREDEKRKLQICYDDMAGLNASFDWNMPLVVMEKATPIIDLDPYFKPEKLAYLMDKFGMPEETDPNVSTLGVISGQIQGNPFILERVIQHDFHEKRYDGELVISWTTYSTDSKGNRVAHHHTQTLRATIYRDAPFYEYETRLIYGNEAAPHLHFSRTPTGGHKMNEKQREKFIRSKAKDLAKLAEQALTKGKGNFTPMGNDEFDVLFNALDRDNEVEFRLLFTPLAQANMVELLEEPFPFGDDFVMVKDGMLTSVASQHSQLFDYSANPINFGNYDYEACKANFVSYCDKFITNLFFDLAPILSIPLYQMHKPREFIYEESYAANVTSFEQETMANSMDQSIFYPEGCDRSLPLLLKAFHSHRAGKGDAVDIHALSYETTPMVEYVPVVGGDGRTHSVPVHWIKYDEVTTVVPIGVTYAPTTRSGYNSIRQRLATALNGKMSAAHFERGLLALYLGRDYLDNDDMEIASIFGN